MSDRIIDPSQQPDAHVDRRHGVSSRRDLVRGQDRQSRNQERKGIEIQDESVILKRLVNRMRFIGNAITATIVGDVAEIAVDVDTTTQTSLIADADLGPLPKYSGQFLIEDSAITDDAVVLVHHVGMSESDDEPELDGILCIPNQPARGSVTVNWHAVPGPVSGPHSFRYLLAAAS